MNSWTDEALTAHGVSFSDEGLHPAPSDFEAWNESLFFDWIATDGTQAGHCRIGRHPGQRRVWFWLYLWDGNQWVRIDEPNLPIADLSDSGWDYHSESLQFKREVVEALRINRLAVSGVATICEGPKAGQSIEVSVDLTFAAAGPAHGMAHRTFPWSDGQIYAAARYEQPCDVDGHVTWNGEARNFTGRGERDHSWGPRFWVMQWTFLVVASESLRAQCTEVLIGDEMRVCVGYIQRNEMKAVQDVKFTLEYAPPTHIHQPFSGSVMVDEGALSGQLIPITGVAIDDSHCLPEEARSIYRRNLVRFEPSDGSAPLWGWMETHRVFEVQ